jgi:hypothetical protein
MARIHPFQKVLGYPETCQSIAACAEDSLFRGGSQVNGMPKVTNTSLKRHESLPNSMAARFDVQLEIPRVCSVSVLASCVGGVRNLSQWRLSKCREQLWQRSRRQCRGQPFLAIFRLLCRGVGTLSFQTFHGGFPTLRHPVCGGSVF